jgi:hypothetical protein
VLRWREDSSQGREALAIVHDDLLERLRRQGLPLRFVAGDGRRSVIANR